MPYEVQLVDDNPKWPPRVHNVYSGNVTTDDVISCFNVTINLLDKQNAPVDIIGIFKEDSSLFNAKGILFQTELIKQLTWHVNLDQIVIVDLNQAVTGDFLKRTLQAALSRPELKVSIMGSFAELNAYLDKKYGVVPVPVAAK